MKIEPLAILCSDIHLSHKCPIARTAEDDWYEAMNRVLEELSILSDGYIPIICAGDIFDRWNAPAELINFALEHLPDRMYTIPGQHDLPNHNMEEIERSAYWTLVKAGKIQELKYWDVFCSLDGIEIYPFPWGKPIIPHSAVPRNTMFQEKYQSIIPIKLAVIHSYIWKDGFGYPGADKEKRVGKYRKNLQGYDAAVFGDNHKGFKIELPEGLTILNSGTLIRRKIDEIAYEPQVGILFSDGSIKIHKLDVSLDKFSDSHMAKTTELEDIDTTELIKELESLGIDSLEFNSFIEKEMDRRSTTTEVRKVILESLS